MSTVPAHPAEPADFVELFAGLSNRHVIVVIPEEKQRMEVDMKI